MELVAVPDKIEASPEIQRWCFDLDQTATPKRIAKCQPRNTAEPQPTLHGPLDGLGMLQLQPDLKRRMVVTKRLIKGLARARARLAEYPWFLEQTGDPCLLARQRVIRGAKHRQFIINPGNHFQIRMSAIALDQAKIDRMARQSLQQIGRIAHLEAYLRLRVPSQELGDDQRCQIVTDGQRGADRQVANGFVPEQQIVDFGGAIEEFDCFRQQTAPLFVETQRLADPVKQLPAGLALQFRQGRAGRRLGKRNLSGSSRNAAVAGNGRKYLELTKGEMHICVINIPNNYNLFYEYYFTT